MEQAQLFVMPDRFDIRIRLSATGSWSLSIDRYVLGKAWTMDQRATYEELSLHEVADVLLEELYTVRS